ncbi:ABC transporter substrate-binding protein [Vibrio marisflavi]|uniref:Fe/B12 periplasmic-binding domain-containing protein n=1 Tax=Vibrio marisflavi CECT 7928 TaxID=634439 RepID=A0ABN8E7W4_9VIBR|nr:ABC transporter substrate-binding protein [Vibrio marisflavi]CAH0541942.1 hypothetical protein VMF7928_03967 [Vibrio marisflavi CECT 7928]
MLLVPRLRKFLQSLSLLVVSLFSISVMASQTIVDQTGQKVVLPNHIQRAVILEHHTLDVAVELGATSQIVGVVRNWQSLLGSDFARLAPQITRLPTPGDLTSVNLEELLSLHPDVVFMSNYAPEQMVKQVQSVGIPVVRMSFFVSNASQRTSFNPDIANGPKAYWQGMKQGITLLGKIFGREKEANALEHQMDVTQHIIHSRIKDLSKAQQTRLYMANPDMNTYGSGKFTGVMMAESGGFNVAHTIHGYGEVSMEQVLAWNPQVIFVQSRYRDIVPGIESDPAWQKIDAVKSHRLFISPEYVKPWGHPAPESFILGELWMAKKLHPKLFADVDLKQRVDEFYRQFYHTAYKPDLQ